MSVEITTAMVNQYSATVFHLSQQKGSRLRPFVRMESQNSEAAFYDRIGSVTAAKKVGRHSDTVYSDTPHSRRRVTLEDYVYADLVDKEDKLRIIMNPESEYVQAGMQAMGRAIDDEVITAALGSAYSGKSGGTAVALPNSQKLAAFDGATTSGSGMNVKTLRAVKKKFNANEAGDDELYICIAAEQIDDMLAETEVTSSDYNAVKALVQGDVDTFMGFKFIRSERLPALAANITTYDPATGSITAGAQTLNVSSFTYRRCFAWQKAGLLLAISQDIQSHIDRLPTKNHAVQVYISMGLGATRLEEVKVVEIICKE